MENQPIQTSRSIAGNVFYGFSTWVLPLALSFIATPIIVKSLGNQDYGIYSLVLGFIGYSFAFGIGRTLTKYIAEYRAEGEIEKIRGIISATFFLNISVGTVSVLLICFLSGWLVREVFEIEEKAREMTISALRIAAFIIFLTMLNQTFSSIMQGVQRFDVYSKIYNSVSVILLTGNIFLAVFGYGVLYLLGWNLAVNSLNCVFGLLAVRRLLPEFGLPINFKREHLNKVIKYSSGVIAYQLLGNFWLLFERGWITANLGAESLTYYVVPMTLGLYLHGFVSSLSLVILPLASELRNNFEKLLKIYTIATKVIATFVGFAAVTLIVQSKMFLSLWISPEFAEKSALVLIIHVLTFSFLSLQVVIWQLSEGLRSPNYNIFVCFLYLLFGIPLMIWLIGDYGIEGIAFARLFPIFMMTFLIFYAEKIFFGRALWKFRGRISAALFFAIIFTAAAEIFISRLLPTAWSALIVEVLAGAFVYFLTLWIFRFITEDEIILFKKLLGKS